MKKEKLAEVPWRNFERAAFESWRELAPPPPSLRDGMRVHGSISLIMMPRKTCTPGFKPNRGSVQNLALVNFTIFAAERTVATPRTRAQTLPPPITHIKLEAWD